MRRHFRLTVLVVVLVAVVAVVAGFGATASSPGKAGQGAPSKGYENGAKEEGGT